MSARDTVLATAVFDEDTGDGLATDFAAARMTFLALRLVKRRAGRDVANGSRGRGRSLGRRRCRRCCCDRCRRRRRWGHGARRLDRAERRQIGQQVIEAAGFDAVLAAAALDEDAGDRLPGNLATTWMTLLTLRLEVHRASGRIADDRSRRRDRRRRRRGGGCRRRGHGCRGHRRGGRRRCGRGGAKARRHVGKEWLPLGLRHRVTAGDLASLEKCRRDLEVDGGSTSFSTARMAGVALRTKKPLAAREGR